MPLPFKTPLTREEQAVLASMPRTRAGNVTDPRYLPPDQRPEYERALGAWCRQNRPSDWPKWVADYVQLRRSERGAAPRTDAAELGAGDHGEPVPGLADGED